MSFEADSSHGSASQAFARLAASPCVRADHLLLALAAAFGPTDEDGALELLDDFGRRLFGIASLPPEPAVERIASAMAADVGLVLASSGVEGLMLDQVLRRRRGHPALLAVVHVEAARRAGVELTLLGGEGDWYVGMQAAGELVLIDFASHTRGPGDRLRLRRHCCHELAHAVLGELSERFAALGREEEAERAIQLQALLPVKRYRSEEDGG